MAKVILQPAGGPDARRHYEDTIAKNVPLAALVKFVRPQELNDLKKIYGKDGGPVWGVVAGINRTKWMRIEPGDIVLFTGQKRIYSKGNITYRLHSPKLARHLWGQDQDGKTWEYIYFLKEISSADIPYEKLNQHAGYSPDYYVPGFSVLDQSRSDNVIKGLGLQGYTEANFNASIAELDKNKDLDARRETLQRTEQGFLRDYLFSGKALALCAICRREFPIELLRAAHIKRRADCSTEEKRDYKNNVMATCTFGCDELFERGYLTVIDGTVRISTDHKITSSTVKRYLDRFSGKTCSWCSAGRKPYFKWHSDKHGF